MRSFTQFLLIVAATAGGLATASGQTTLVSVDSNGVQANYHSWISRISGDGNVVVFESLASNLVPGDTNGFSDIFVRHLDSGVTECASVDPTGVPGNQSSYTASASADGTVVAFLSDATNLVAGDNNGVTDVFVRDLVAGTTERISVDPLGGDANSSSYQPAISADGRFVAFGSNATNLVSGYPTSRQMYVRDRTTGITSIVSVDDSLAAGNGPSFSPAICADGHAVAFASLASNLVFGDTNNSFDVFVRDLSTGHTERVSVDSNGGEALGSSGQDGYLGISDDGNVVVFGSTANNLVQNDTDTTWEDAFVHDRVLGFTNCLDTDSAGNTSAYGGYYATISGDGRFAAFSTYASLLSQDTDGVDDVYLVDLYTGTKSLASVDSSWNLTNSSCDWPSLSHDGSRVAFGSNATNLVPGDNNGLYDVFTHDDCVASWDNYGTPFPGTLGVPTLTMSEPPALGATFDFEIGNSLGSDTWGILFFGWGPADNLFRQGQHFLVGQPAIPFLLYVPAAGLVESDSFPNDPSLDCTDYYFQVLEADPGAIKNISCSQGLHMHLGR